MTSLKKKNKNELINMVEEMQKDIASLKVEDSPDDTNDKVSNLVAEITRLQDQLKIARETDKFVAIENLSLGNVWLYAPESKSGRPEDRNKGRLLKKVDELAIVPSYWMATFISDRAPAFTMGELRLNNERGRAMSPHLVFEDYDLPEEFIDAAISNEEINKSIGGTSEDFYDFIEEHKGKTHVLNRVYGVLDRKAHATEEKTKARAVLDGFLKYLDEILYPAVDGSEEREEVKVAI